MNNTFKKIYEIHKKQLNNLNYANKKIAICFAGIPGSGKTYIAKLIEERYKGVRINSDDLRKIIFDIFPNKNVNEREEILQNYLKEFVPNFKSKNGLIVIDSGVERKYKIVFPLLKKNGYRILVIQMNVSRMYAKKGVIKKLGKLDRNFVNNIRRWVKEFNDFSKNYKSDIILEEGYGLGKVFVKLDNLVTV